MIRESGISNPEFGIPKGARRRILTEDDSNAAFGHNQKAGLPDSRFRIPYGE